MPLDWFALNFVFPCGSACAGGATNSQGMAENQGVGIKKTPCGHIVLK